MTVDALETVTLTATLIDSSDALLATIFTKVQGGGDQASLADTIVDVTTAVAGQTDAQLAADKLRLDGAMALLLGVASNATWSVDVGYLRVTHEKIGL